MSKNKVYTFQWTTDMGIFHVTMYPDQTVEAKKIADAPVIEPTPLPVKNAKGATRPKEKANGKVLSSEQEKATMEKIKKFFTAWSGMMKAGCVSKEVYQYRRGLCEGVEGKNLPCPKLKLGSDKKTFYCGGCGCGERAHAALFVKGKELGNDYSPRLWMPDSQCPIQAIRPAEGQGNLKPLGGRIREAARLGIAAAKELSHRRMVKKQKDKIIEQIGGQPPEAYTSGDI